MAMKQRILPLLLTAAMLCAMIPAGAQAAENTGIPYEVEGGTIYFDPAAGAVTGFGGDPVSVDIPAQIGGTAVTSIADYAFMDCMSLTNITVPDSVTSIGTEAFYHCSLVSATINGRIDSISDALFSRCSSLVSVNIPDSVTSIGSNAFSQCYNLSSIDIPASVTSIGSNAFQVCWNLTSAEIPDGVQRIEEGTFQSCSSLKSVSIPDSVASIGENAFGGDDSFGYCDELKDIYYSGSSSQWGLIDISPVGNDPLNSAAIHYADNEAADPGADTVLQPQFLEDVYDQASAVDAVQKQLAGMTPEQKQSPDEAYLATLFAEEAAARAASKSAAGSDILINAAAVHDLEQTAASATAAVESALVEGGVSVARYLSATATLVTSETGPISIRIDPDILSTTCDRVRIQTPSYALTFKVADLEPDLNGILTFSAEEVSPDTVRVTMPGGTLSSPATLAIIGNFGASRYEAVVSQDSGTAVSSKYNPATGNMDGKVNTSGTYTVRINQKDFTDIGNKSAEMQNAIRDLASKGIIAGTTETTFSPDGTISRAEIAKLLVYTLNWTDSSSVSTFSDVSRSSWYSGVAAVSQKRGLINGYPDNTFRGTTVISKEQIVTLCGRILHNEVNYKVPEAPAMYLARYKDGVSKWAQPMVALCTRENLVIQRYDGRFLGLNNMTRGDAAIIIYRLFQRI